MANAFARGGGYGSQAPGGIAAPARWPGEGSMHLRSPPGQQHPIARSEHRLPSEIGVLNENTREPTRPPKRRQKLPKPRPATLEPRAVNSHRVAKHEPILVAMRKVLPRHDGRLGLQTPLRLHHPGALFFLDRLRKHHRRQPNPFSNDVGPAPWSLPPRIQARDGECAAPPPLLTGPSGLDILKTNLG